MAFAPRASGPLKGEPMTPDLIGQPDSAISLSLAMVESFNSPLLLLDGDLRVLSASASFCAAFSIPKDDVSGTLLADLGAGEWAVPQLGSLLKATADGHAAIDAYLMDLKRPGQDSRCLLINAQKLKYGDGTNIRMLVAVQDITDQRTAEKQKDDLVREKAILLQELQHRVANSLQIIASVLMQSARNVSDEAKGHIFAAHNRVISVAAIQEHLSPARLGDVELRSYFAGLCRSIGASMIHDHDLIQIEVRTDDSVTLADISVSLGLIATELIINSLKYAFPGGRAGKINVDYQASAAGWILAVSDDGVGMRPAIEHARSGLGTTIVKSLAEQLGAYVEVEDGAPGTRVSIIQDNESAAGTHPKPSIV
jgi:two-component sensor histidine kinase